MRTLALTVVAIISTVIILAADARATAEPVASAARFVEARSPEGLGSSEPIHFPDDLQPYIETMLTKSPTFQRQWRTIFEASSLRLRVEMDPRISRRSYRARSIIHRSEAGHMTAVVEVAFGRDLIEWIAHEFEHVIEQLEGVPVAALAARGQGAWPFGRAYETTRAVQVGRTVRREVDLQ